jgi:hypothetical protein
MNNYSHPINIPKFDIYDIFFSNGQVIIISPCENQPLNIKLIKNQTIDFNLLICPHKHTYIYYLNNNYEPNIKLSINEEIIETNVNKYPNYENKILMSTIVKDEDEYICQWINYHNLMGIEKFIIYDNSENYTLENKLQDFINKEIVLLIKWPYPYRLPKNGISGQTTQQNHSLYAFKNAKYIGMFDIDEYINPQNDYTNINCFFNDYITQNNIDITQIGSFRLLNKLFYNPNNLPTKNYDFLKIYNCDNISYGEREKNFIIPQNVDIFAVHMITSGKPMYTIDPNLIFFNHYFFLNKNDRGKNITSLTDSSIKNKVDLLNIKNITKPKIYFLTFANSQTELINAVYRLCNQATEFNIFEKIYGLTEKDLIEDENFWPIHKDFILNNNRGYGYWIWKPYLILKILNNINENDILLYLDAGCELNANGKEYFTNNLIPKVNEKKIIGCETSVHTSHSNDITYTKMDLIKYLNMDNSPTLSHNHMQSGCVMMKKCYQIVKLYEEFYNISCNYHMIDDSPSIEPNKPIFKEHRHDQSILNLLVKKYNLINYDLDPTDWGHTIYSAQQYKKYAMNYPIWYCRNRTGTSLKQFF